MTDDSIERNRLYAWARTHGIYNPYDFAIMNEEHWGDKERLAEMARRWERDHLLDRKKRIEEQMEELRRKLEIVEGGLQLVDEYPYD
jgi:predicted ABC-class ATPase